MPNQSTTLGPSQRFILYIEDNQANLALVEQLVERRSDWTLLAAASAQAGLRVARRECPDMILMDINLPDMSGLAALKSLRDDPATAHIPVIALSADAYPRQIENGIEAGFLQYLTKPFKIEEFMTAIETCLNASSEHQHSRMGSRRFRRRGVASSAPISLTVGAGPLFE